MNTTINTTTNSAAGRRAVILFLAHRRRVRTGGQYTEQNMGLLVAKERACRVAGIR